MAAEPRPPPGDRLGLRWHAEPPTHYTVDALAALGVRHAFSTRHHPRPEGVGAPGGPFPPDRRWPALEALALDPRDVRVVRQVHGVACVSADEAPGPVPPAGDALVTAVRGRPLAVFTADCLPVILVEPTRGVLALAHAGWRGTVGGILGRVVAALGARHGTDPTRLTAVVGPSIGPCCYEVDAAVVAPLSAAFPDLAPGWVQPTGISGRWWLDLWQAGQDQLVAAGVPAPSVWNPRHCTGCRRDLFVSYRKEGAGGRLFTVAALA